MAAGFRPAESTSPRSYIEARAPLEARAVQDDSFAHAQDFALAQRAAEGDARAERQIGQRLIVRVRRSAQALLAGAIEADDAAQHALIELLRAVRSYPGETSLERWADHLVARSLLRFARALRAHQVGAGQPAAASEPLLERSARTREEFLRALPSGEREALLLREAFGFDLVETSRLMRCAPRALREQLSRARKKLHLRTIRDAEGSLPLPDAVERWFTLRDRQHVVSPRALDPETGASNDALSANEDEELRALAGQPALRRLQRELRALMHLVEGGRPSLRDKKLLAQVLAAVRVSSDYGPRAAVDAAIAAQRAAVRSEEPVDESWVRPISMFLCVALVAGAFVALAMRRPQAAFLPGAPVSPARTELWAPTVQALSSAQAGERGARLSRAGELLTQGMSLREDDVVVAGDRPGCFGLSPRADVCLAASSEARIVQLGSPVRRVELMRGRAVASVAHVESALPFALSAHELRVETSDAVFGLERDGERIVVRVLRGAALVATPQGTHALGAPQSAIYRLPTGQLELVPQLPEKARRDWELLAARELGRENGANTPMRASAKPSLAAEESPVRPLVAPASEGPDGHRTPAVEVSEVPSGASEVPSGATVSGTQGDAPALPAADSPEDTLARAKELARGRRHAEAAELYLKLIRGSAETRSAREALVLRGELLSERLGRADEGLELFDRYLRSGGGLLEARARYGRIRALHHMGRVVESRAAAQEFLFSHGDTAQARTLRARMKLEN